MILSDLVLPSGHKQLHPKSVCVCVSGWGQGEKLACTYICVLCFVRRRMGQSPVPIEWYAEGPLRALCAGGRWKEGSHWPWDGTPAGGGCARVSKA